MGGFSFGGGEVEFKTFYELAKSYKNINAFAATCQSALETGNWTSKLWVLARNGAGIKAGTAWRDGRNDYILISSPEYRDGKYVAQNSYFRAYNSTEEFLADYALKIKNDYPHCTSDNVWGYFAGLYKGRWGKWATDHKYFEKLARKAVALEPILLSKGHLKRSFSYAIDKHYLEDWQIQIIEAVMK